MAVNLIENYEQRIDDFSPSELEEKLEIEILKDNHKNSTNRDVLYICAEDLNRSTPTKDYKFEQFKHRVKTCKASSRKRRN